MINRLQNWVEVKQVITKETVSVTCFGEVQPKEPAAVHHDGRFYVACAVWDAAGVPKRKEVVLCVADSYDGPFRQICRVTDAGEYGIYNHAPAAIVADGDLWIFHAHKRRFTEKRPSGINSIRALHAPIDNLPAGPEGWTDEGTVIETARDPGLVKGPDGTYFLFATGEDGEWGIIRYESTDLKNWSNRTLAWKPFTGKVTGEAAEIVPKEDGSGYWLLMLGQTIPRLTIAADAPTLRDEFTGRSRIICYHDSMNGIRNAFHSQKTQHHDYLYRAGGDDIHKVDGEVVAYFEGFDGKDWSLGVCCAEE